MTKHLIIHCDFVVEASSFNEAQQKFEEAQLLNPVYFDNGDEVIDEEGDWQDV